MNLRFATKAPPWFRNREDRMKDSVLVTLADGNYVEQAKQLFSSVYQNAGWQGDYLLLAHRIAEPELQWFRQRGIGVMECEPVSTPSGRYVGHAPLTTLCKFYLFTPGFRKWRNVVFLDGDIIVRGSLESLTRIRGFGAVRILNIFRTRLAGQFHRRNRKYAGLFEELENRCDLRAPAFNAGVMAFSTDLIEDGVFEALKNLFDRFRDIIFISEETVLNMYFYGKWQELSQVYNICPSYEMYLGKRRPDELSGIILHTYSNFPGGKPWRPASPLNHEWNSNRARAEEIELSSRPAARITLSHAEETERDRYLKNLHRRHLHRLVAYRFSRFYRYRIRPRLAALWGA